MANTSRSPQKPKQAPLTTEQMNEALRVVMGENVELREHLGRVGSMFKIEDRGWEKFGPDEQDGGMSREDVNEWSKQIREAIVGNPWIGAAIRLRNSYIFQDGGIFYEGIPKVKDGRSKQANVQALIDDPMNQAHFFSAAAHKERESANYSDGNVYYLGDDATHSIEPILLEQIDAEYRNPDNESQVWAFRRRWIPKRKDAVEKVVWYFTDTYKSKAVDSKGNALTHIGEETNKYEIDLTKTLFDGRVNTQLNWAHGIPDAVSALVWARIYTEFMTNGKIMTDALAQFAFQASSGTAKGQKTAGASLAQQRRPGATVVTGSADSLVPLSSAGKGYDFTSGTAILAAVATSIGVSVIHLSSDPGTAGSSYGSASTLDLPTQLATNDRREWHAEFDTRVLRWMGAPEAHAYFKPLTDTASILRKIQAWAALWNMGLYEGDEIRTQADETMGLRPGKAPKGIMLPNNKDFVDTLTNDGQTLPKDAASTADQKNADPSAAGTGRGKSTGAGSNPKASDKRTDQIAQSLSNMELSDKIDRLMEMLERA